MATTSPSPSLSSAALQLLPGADASPKCADFSASINIDPGGNAIAAGIVLVIETPLPWPKPIFAHPFLEGVAGVTETSCGMSRILGAVPETPETVGRVHAWWRVEEHVHQAVLQVNSNADVHALLAELEQVTPAESRFVTQGPGPQRAVLICTQGSHDICCGTLGTRLAEEAQTALDDVRVFRVSHTGGHRFSPTAMTLPDGRMWAYLDLAQLSGILTETIDVETVAPQCRGWWGAGRGAAQMAERAVFAEVGWSVNSLNRTVADLGNGHFEVQAGPDRWRVRVVPGRDIPTISCRAEGGLPAKPGKEFAVASIEPLL